MHLLTHYGLIKLQGDRTASFLQGQLTCDIRQLGQGQAQFGAYCDHRGRVLASLWVIALADQYLLVLPKDNLTATQMELQKFAQFSRVLLEDVSHAWQVAGQYSSDSAANDLPAGAPSSATITIPVAGKRQLVLGQTLRVDNSLSSAEWRQANINDQFAEIYAATRELFTPHMLNYPAMHAVSFNKGCYRGQEIIARTEHLGKSKRLLAQLDWPQPMAIGAELINEEQKKIGMVVEACANSKQILAVISNL